MLFDGLGGEPLERPIVIIQGGRIADIIQDVPSVELSGLQGETIDMGSGTTLVPGLIDAHVHLVCTGGKAAFSEVIDKPKDTLTRRAKENAKTALAAGITTVRDAGGKNSVTLQVRDSLLDGPRILACAMPVTTRGGHLHFFGLEADTDAEIDDAISRIVSLGADFIKVMASAGIQTVGNDPFSTQYSSEVLARLTRHAHDNGLRVAAHAHSVESIENAIAAGVDTIEHFTCLREPAPDDALLRRLAEWVVTKGIIVDPTAIALDAGAAPSGGLTPNQRATMLMAMDLRQRVLQVLNESGVELAGGTDAGSTGVGFSDVGRGVALLSGIVGWSASQAIRSVTYASAKALGIDAETGALKPGSDADLVVVAGDPRLSLEVLDNILLVVRRGKVVIRSPLLRPDGWSDS